MARSSPGPCDWQVYLLRVKRMIYGLNVAPSVIDQLTRPIVRHLHSRGIRFSLMCDDGLTVANSKSRAEADHQKVLDMFQRAGGFYPG